MIDQDSPEFLYASLCEQFPDGVFILDDKGKIFHANPGCHRILKYPNGSLKGKTFEEFIYDEESRRIFSDFIETWPSSMEFREITMRKGDGSLCCLDLTLTVMEVDKRRFIAMFLRDAAEQRLLAMEKTQKEVLLRNVFSAIEDGISILDRDLTIVQVNAWMEKRYREDVPLKGKKCFEVYQKRRDVCPWCPSVPALETGVSQFAQVPYPAESDPKGWLELYSFPIRDRQGKITGVVEYVKDVTEQKKLRDALAESEGKYRTFFESLDVCAYRTTKEGRFLDINPAGIRLFGYDKEELLRLNVSDIYESPEERDHFLTEIEKNGAVYDYPLRLRRKNGNMLSCRITAVPISDKDGRFIGQQGIIRDVTEQERLKNALSESERRYRTFFESSAIFAYITDREGNILQINRAALDLIGYEKEELKTLSAADLYVDPAERGRFLEEIGLKGVVTDFRIHLRRKDGKILTCLDTATLIRDFEGNPETYLGIIRDITEKERDERALIRFKTLLIQTDAMVVITDLNGTIEFVNPAFERITRYSFDEAMGQNPRILKSGRHDEAFYRNLWETITSGESWHGRFYNKRKDGTFYYEDAHIFPIKDKRGRIINFAAIKRDITHEVMLEEQLRQTAKLEAIGKLAGSIAHDFNNILTTIQGFAELGLSRLDPQNPSWKNFSEIFKASKQASRITQQLLGFSRKQIISPKALSVHGVIKEMIPLLERYIEENLQLKVALSAERDVVIADRGQLEQCVLNLVINARDALREKSSTNEEKSILIETEVAEIDEIYLKTRMGITEGRYIVIAVSDTGVGMDEETLSKIFDPFFTTKPLGEGTGLGCSTVFGIVKQNGGNVRAYSEPGMGTTVKIYWPLAGEEVVAETEEEEPLFPVTMRGIETILVVEDDRGIREFVTQALSSLGYTVYGAENGVEALKLIDEQGITPDLLFTDVIMPGMNGKELAGMLSKRFENLKILFTSGYTENHIAHNGILTRNIDFLHKPYTVRELLKKVRSILDNRF